MRDVEPLKGPWAVCCPRSDDPTRKVIAGATPEACHRCQAEVMISPASRRRLRPGDRVLCIECFIAIAEERGTPWIDPGRNDDQLRELAANGHEPRQFELG